MGPPVSPQPNVRPSVSHPIAPTDHLRASHTRHPSGVALGALSLNLSLPPTLSCALGQTLSTLLPRLSELPLSIPLLNSPKTSLAPRNRNENLESGALQLADGTTVLVDMRGVGEGKLEDRGMSSLLLREGETDDRTGVRNLRHLTTTVASQKLSYEFPYSSFDLETDLAFILLSEGKALVPVRPLLPPFGFANTRKDGLRSLRPPVPFVRPSPASDGRETRRVPLVPGEHARGKVCRPG